MKKKLFFISVLIISATMMAQQKVAILETVDKAQNVSYGVKLLLRSSLTSAISNTPGYEGYDRVDMASIAGEQEFQRTGNVSDSQIRQIGKAAGAAYVLVAEAAKYDATSIIITAKLLDVETFGVKSSAVMVSGVSADEMQESCLKLATQLLGSSKKRITADMKKKPEDRSAQNFAVEVEPEKKSTSANEQTTKYRRKSPFLAGTMSFLIPGLGQVYNGEYIKAGIVFGVAAIGGCLSSLLEDEVPIIIGAGLSAGAWAYGVVDAVIVAKNINNQNVVAFDFGNNKSIGISPMVFNTSKINGKTSVASGFNLSYSF